MNEITHEVPFKVNGTSITDIARDIYFFQHRENAALQILAQFEGLPLDTAYEIINGNAKLVSVDDGKNVKVVFEEDKEFKKQLTEVRENLKKQKEVVEEHQKVSLESRRGWEETDSMEQEIQKRTLIFINAFISRISIPIAYSDKMR